MSREELICKAHLHPVVEFPLACVGALDSESSVLQRIESSVPGCVCQLRAFILNAVPGGTGLFLLS